MEDLDYAGINFGVISFLYLFFVGCSIQINAKNFPNSQQATNEGFFDQVLDAFVIWPIQKRIGPVLICIEKIVTLFLIFTNSEVAQSIFYSNHSYDFELGKVFKYVIIPLICFAALIFQKVLYLGIYYLYSKCMKSTYMVEKYQKFAFSDPRTRSMYFFGIILTNLSVIVIFFSDSPKGTFGYCFTLSWISSGIQVGIEFVFILILVSCKINSLLYTILFQQKREISQTPTSRGVSQQRYSIVTPDNGSGSLHQGS